MATERQEFVLSARQEGFDALLRDLAALGTGVERLSRIGSAVNRRDSAFSDLIPQDQLALLKTSLRDYDRLLGKVNDLHRAEVARNRAEIRLSPTIIDETGKRVENPKYIKDPLVRAEVDSLSRGRVNRQAELLEKEYNNVIAALSAEAAAARRRAVLGPTIAAQITAPALSPLEMTRNRMRQIAEQATKEQREDDRLLERRVKGQEDLDQWWMDKQHDDRVKQAADEERRVERERKAQADLDQRRRDEEFDRVHGEGEAERKRAEREDLAQANLDQRRRDEEFERRHREGQEKAEARRKSLEAMQSMRAYQGFTPSYARPDLSTSRGVLESGVNSAERNHAVALNKRTELLNRGGATFEELMAADDRVAASGRRVVAARNKLADDINRESEAQRQRGIYQGFQPTYANPDLFTKVGRQEDRVNKAERAVETALNNRAEVQRKVSAGELVSSGQLHRSEQAVRDANTAYADQTRKLALIRAQTTPATTFGGVRDQFMTGFRGASDLPYAQQIGQAFKFSVFYGTAYKLLFALTTTLTATLQEGIEFQQAMTDLSLAAGRPKEELEGLAQNLGDSAVATGFAPSQGVQIGARALGMYGVTQASAADQERVAQISADVVNKLAVGAKKTPVELQGDIAAIAQALGTGVEGQYTIGDLDAYMTKRFGAPAGSTLETVAQSASVGKSAGFTDEELFAIAAQLISRTGQTSSAVAGYMAQIFSRGGEGSLVDASAKLGIDPRLPLDQILKGLSQQYADARPQKQAEISAAFGRGKVQNAAVALLTDYDEIQQVSADARSGASTGALDQQVETRLGDIGGMIKVMLGELKELAQGLGDSGVLDAIGLLVLAVTEGAEALNKILGLWNLLPDVTQDVILALGLLALAAKSQAAAGVGHTIANATLARASAAGVPAAFSGAAGAGAAGALANVGKMGLAAARFIGPVGLAIGGLLAIATVKEGFDEMDAALKAGNRAILDSGGLGTSSTSSDYRASASELDALAKDLRESDTWYLPGKDDEVANLEAEAGLRRRAAELMDKRAEAASLIPGKIISGFDADSLAMDMDLITRAGGGAQERLKALTGALDGTRDAALEAANAFDPELFSIQLSTMITDGIKNLKKRVRPERDLTFMLGEASAQFTGGKNPAPLDKVPYEFEFSDGFTGSPQSPQRKFVTKTLPELMELTPADIQARLEEQLSDRGIDSFEGLDRATVKGIADSVFVADDFEAIPEESRDDVRTALVAMVKQMLFREAKGWRQILKGNRKLKPSEVMDALTDLQGNWSEREADIPESDLGQMASTKRAQLARLRRLRDQDSESGGREPELIRAIIRKRREVAEAEIARLDQVRRVQQQGARSTAEIRAIGMRSMKAQMSEAVLRGNRDALADIVAKAGSGATDIARKIIQDAMNVVKASLGVRAQFAAVQAAANGALDGINTLIGPVDPSIEKDAVRLGEQLGQFQKMLKALATFLTGDKNQYTHPTDVPGVEEPEKKEKTKEQREADREAARQEMLDLQSNLYLLSIDMRDPLAMAVAAVKDARRRLQSDIASGQDRNTIAASRVALRQAQIEQQETARQEMLELRNNLYLLSIDLTDPLAQATAGVKEARRRLQSDIAAGATPSVIAGDKVAIKQAEAEREATAFQQRLDAVTTAEELGRISHRKYLSYLQNERRRLDAIKNRTFQQQEQLDQIDRLMKDAADSMQGMWNFGDIKLPTPYQVRRQVEQMRLDRSTQLDATSRQVASQSTIYIDGADTGKVRQIINETLSKSNATVTNRPRRR